MARFDTNLPKPFVHTGFTPGGAAMGPVDEVPHSLREVPQRSPASGRYPQLLHGLRTGGQPRVLGAGRSQLGTLRVEAGSPPSRPPILLLLESQVPDEPGAATVLRQHRGLLSGGNQPKPGHPCKVVSNSDKLTEGRERRLFYRPKPAESTPHIL